jgi:hypothetical protein
MRMTASIEPSEGGSAKMADGAEAYHGMRALMRRALIVGLGVLVTVAGVIFALQGLGYIAGSVMTGTTLWSVLGPLIAVGGLGIVAVGFRVSRR